MAGKPVEPLVVAGILGTILAFGGVMGAAYWNGAMWFQETNSATRQSHFRDLKLARLVITPTFMFPGGALRSAFLPETEGDATASKPPVPYLPYQPKPAPPPGRYGLTPGRINAFREIALARLEQGGMPVPDAFMPDPENPNRRIPIPPEVIGPTNGRIELHFETREDQNEKGTVIFRITWELWREMYLARDSTTTTPCKVEGGTAGPFRVWEKDLESAIIYELEKMIKEQIVPQYRAANPGAKGK